MWDSTSERDGVRPPHDFDLHPQSSPVAYCGSCSISSPPDSPRALSFLSVEMCEAYNLAAFYSCSIYKHLKQHVGNLRYQPADVAAADSALPRGM